MPEGASSAHLVLGQVPHYAIKPGTLVWTDAESLHGGANGTTWGGLVPLKNGGWKMSFLLGFGLFSGAMLVLGRKWGTKLMK